MIGTSTASKVLSGLAASQMRAQRFAADVVAPPVPMDTERAVVAFVDRGAIGKKQFGDLRGYGSAATMIDGSVSYPVSLFNQHHALATLVPDENLASEAMALRSKTTYLETFVVHPLMIAKEKVLTDLLASILTGDRTSSPSTKWDASGASPITDIKIKIKAAKTASGTRPNLFVCDENVLGYILDSAEAQDRLKHDGSAKDGSVAVQERQLAQMLGIERVYSTSCTYNSGANNATPSFADCWGETALLARVEAPSILSSNAFIQTVWNAPDAASGKAGGLYSGWRVSEMYDAERHGWRLEGGQYYDIKSAYADDASADAIEVAQLCAHLFTNVLA